MRYIFISILLFSALITQAQHTLKVDISGLKNDEGQVMFVLMDSQENKVAVAKEAISNSACTITIVDLPTGTYSFKFFHDENKDEELNTNMVGYPKEGFGFSNNAKGSFGAPPLKDTLFEINSDVSQDCEVMYL